MACHMCNKKGDFVRKITTQLGAIRSASLCDSCAKKLGLPVGDGVGITDEKGETLPKKLTMDDFLAAAEPSAKPQEKKVSASKRKPKAEPAKRADSVGVKLGKLEKLLNDLIEKEKYEECSKVYLEIESLRKRKSEPEQTTPPPKVHPVDEKLRAIKIRNRERQMEELIKQERYEECAKLRDEIEEIKRAGTTGATKE